MHRIQRMDPIVGPAQCLCCGRGNTPDAPDTEDDLWFIDLERDINWGDPAYICKYCCDLIAQEAGNVSAEDYESATETADELRKQLHSVEAELDAVRRRQHALLEGRKAVKEIKKEKKSASRSKAAA